MATKQKEKEIEKLKMALGLDVILLKAQENYHWDKSSSKKALDWYLKHWWLCIKYPNLPIASISKAADDLWHQHILDTRKYAVDCQQIIGTFLHHTPIYGKPTKFEIAAYDQTIELYRAEFKVLPDDISKTSGNYSYRPSMT